MLSRQIVFLFLLVITIQNCNTTFYPLPTNCSTGNNSIEIDSCSIIYYLTWLPTPYQTPVYQQIINQYHNQILNCQDSAQIVYEEPDSTQSYYVNVNISNITIKSVFKASQQNYSILINDKFTNITAQTYVGFLRAIQTFSQSIQCYSNNCTINNIPINISDVPAFAHRGVLIDSARHYLSVDGILQTIDAMMYSKMNVLHWHIVDDDSFPLVLDSHPELAKYGAFSSEEVYTKDNVYDIVSYALTRGVRVIPELDTPGHAASWGRAQVNKQIACTNGNNSFKGALDITLKSTYQIIEDVFTQVLQMFIDPFVHLGGDQIQFTCLTNLSSLQIPNSNLQSKQTKDYLENYYRHKQRKIIKQIDQNKIPIYWSRDFNQTLKHSDTIHWWANQENGLPNISNKMIISIPKIHYLDMGFGLDNGSYYNQIATWKQIYNYSFKQKIANYSLKNVLGGQVTLWSQLSNNATHHLKLWDRAIALGEILWNTQVNISNTQQFNNVRLRFINQLIRLEVRGIQSNPIANQICYNNFELCK